MIDRLAVPLVWSSPAKGDFFAKLCLKTAIAERKLGKPGEDLRA